MRFFRVFRPLGILIAIVLIAGCAIAPVVNVPAKSAHQIAKEKSLYFMSVYHAQYKDAEAMGAMAQQGKLSLGQLQIYRVKRDLLIKLKPLIVAFDTIVAGGGIPAPGREQEINDIINVLVSQAGGA